MTTASSQEWKPLAEYGFSAYEASHRGAVRSIDRTMPDGRRLKGRVLKPRPALNGYLLVNLTDDTGVVRTRTVHSLVMLAHVGEPPAGEEVCHAKDNPLDNRWPESLSYGTHERNVRQRMENRPARPRPVRLCVRCSAPFTGNGRRCHECVVTLGLLAAEMLRAGMTLKAAAGALEYPSEDGLHTLAVKYGGYGIAPEPWWRRVTRRLTWPGITQSDTEAGHTESPKPRSRKGGDAA